MKHLLLSLCLTIPLFAAPFEVIEECCELEILTPTLQQVERRKIRLDNGLEALLISDPNTDESGAALTVDVGSWQDPVEWPGQAHFIEHMLFLGNTTYPEENGMRRFLDEHGGSSNAYTAVGHTNYIFSINNNALPEALARFAAMFVSPRFAQESMAREEHAVDQEFTRAIENDGWRTELIHRQLNNPNHPDSRFGMGNLDTLGEMTHAQAKGWFENHYSANLMHLVIISDLPLDELQELVVKDFSAIPDRQLRPFTVTGRRRGGRTLGRTLHIAPYQNVRELQLSWELPYDYQTEEETHASGLLSYVLGHEGQGSLLAALKQEGLAEWLASGSQADRKPDSDHFLFDIRIGLTEKGVKERELVITRLFEAIRRLQNEPLPQSLYDETQTMSRLSYERQTRQNVYQVVSSHARGLTQEPIATYPQATLLASRFDPAAVRKLANNLTPSLAHITLAAPSAESGARLRQREKYMRSQFGLEAIDSDAIETWENVTLNETITLPSPNPYLPEKLDLIEGSGATVQIQDNDFGHLYFTPDTSFETPEVAWQFYIKSDAIQPGDSHTAALTDLLAYSVQEHLNQEAYSAALGGLSYSLAPAEFGVRISVDGYSDKADEFLDTILSSLKTGTPSPSQFATYRDALKKSYENAAKEAPFRQAMDLLKETLYRHYVTTDEKLRALETIDHDALLAFFDTFPNQTFIEGILFGNLTRETADTITNHIRTQFQNKSFAAGRDLRPIVTQFPPARGPHLITKRINTPGNAALLAIDEGEFTFLRRAAQQILGTSLEEPFFSALRTKQQTGYLVHSWNQEIEHRLFQFFAVESKSHDGRDLLSRFEEQIEFFLQNPLPEARFEKIKTSLIAKLSQAPKNPPAMAARLWQLAFIEQDFNFIDQRLTSLRDLTYPEFLVLSKEFLGKANKKRVALLIAGTMPPETSLRYTKARSPAKIKRLAFAD